MEYSLHNFYSRGTSTFAIVCSVIIYMTVLLTFIGATQTLTSHAKAPGSVSETIAGAKPPTNNGSPDPDFAVVADVAENVANPSKPSQTQ